MIRIKTGDGTEFAVEGEEAQVALGQLKRLLDGHDMLVRMRSEIARIGRDVTFLVRQYDGDANAHPEVCTLKGTRRRQFELVCAHMKAHPKSSILAPCRAAVREIKGADGYTSARSLQRYCCAHRHSFNG